MAIRAAVEPAAVVVRTVMWIALLVGAAYAATCGLAFAFQRRLLYFPERTTESAALERASRLGLEPWRFADGSLRGWRAAPRTAARARVLVFHGNGGSALDRDHYVTALALRGISVTLLEYPGYGPRPGAPSERALTAAAVDAVDELAADSPAPLWLVGESLGCGVAARAARLRPTAIRGLLLIAPFNRLVELAHRHYPFLPIFLLRDRWSPRDDLAGFEGPTAMLIAGRDEIVTAEQGRKLFEALRGRKRMWEQPRATHNGFDLSPEAPFWDEVVEFLGRGGRVPPT